MASRAFLCLSVSVCLAWLAGAWLAAAWLAAWLAGVWLAGAWLRSGYGPVARQPAGAMLAAASPERFVGRPTPPPTTSSSGCAGPPTLEDSVICSEAVSSVGGFMGRGSSPRAIARPRAHAGTAARSCSQKPHTFAQ
eukprot:scaffold11721_cov63-Phaeocystis_antarctica.AAC.5